MSHANVSWTSVERWVDLPLCENLQYVVALRAPLARTLHQLMHLFFYYHHHYDLNHKIDFASLRTSFFKKLWGFERVRDKLRGAAQTQAASVLTSISELTDWLDLWLGFASNYQTRSLAGRGDGAAFLESRRSA